MKLRLLAALIIIFTFPVSADTADNITLELRFDAGQIYSDGSEVNSDPYSTDSFDYPYIVSDRPIGIVSYSEALEIFYENISVNEDKIGITQSDGEFLLPHTINSYQTIEDKENEVRNRDLLGILNPSFSFSTPTSTFVKVSYIFPYNITSFEGRKQDMNQLTVRNKLSGGNDIELGLKGD